MATSVWRRRAVDGAVDDWFFVLEPGAHAGVGYRIGNRRSRQPGGVVFDVKPLRHDVREKSSRPARFLNAARASPLPRGNPCLRS
jgi:hypothetical protein